MSDWILVPCLVALRAEFNAVSPSRDRGADGSIGDSSHTSSSDHTPDEDSDVLRDHDADHKNEVHALDIDSSGPWPGGAAWFDAAVKGIVDRHRRGEDDRLQYAIWNRKIASRSYGWVWRTYTGTADPHTNHVHFSARYTTTQEQDTSRWLPTAGDDMSVQDVRDYFKSAATGVRGGGDAFSRADRDDLAAVLRFALGINWSDQDKVTTTNQITALTNALSNVPASTAGEVLRRLDAVDSNPPTVSGASADEVAELLAQKLAARLAA
jgi:hypothetical protein